MHIKANASKKNTSPFGGAGRRCVSKRNFKKESVNSSGSESMATSFEKGNKTSRFIKDRTFHDPMTDYQILRQKSAALIIWQKHFC